MHVEETERKAKGSFVYLCKLNAPLSVSARSSVLEVYRRQNATR